MKTISLRKKVAAVAVASLGFGLLSVVPANAVGFTWTMTRGTVTPADGSAIVGSTVTIPVNLATAAASDKASVDTFTASFFQKPINTSSTLAAGIVNRDAAFATAGASLTQITASGAVLTATVGATAARITNATLAGEFTFTPDTPGLYIVTIAGAVDTTSTVGGGSVAATVSDVLKINIIVGGAALTQAAAGKSTASGSAVVGGSAVFVYHVPGATAANTVYNVTSSGVGSLSNAKTCADEDATLEGTDTEVRCAAGASMTATTINGTNYADGAKFTNAALTAGNALTAGTVTTAAFSIDAGSSAVGTQTITVSSVNQSTGVPTTAATVVITWTSSAAGASTGYSTVFIGAGNTCATVDASPAVKAASTAVGVNSANICITLKDSSGIAINGQPVTATIEGPGLMFGAAGTATNTAGAARAVSLTSAAMVANNTAKINIAADGTSGTTSVKVYQGTTLLATKTMYFYGTVATLTATQNLKVARAGSAGYTLGTSDGTGLASAAITAALTPAVVIVAKDAAGVVVPGLTITGLSSDTTVISSSTVAEAVGTASTTGAAGPGNYLASVTSAVNGTSGKSATVTFRTLLSTGAYISAAPLTFTLGGSLATGKETISFDKTSYAPGEAMTVTVTAKDSAGNAVYDGVTSPTLTASKSVGGSLPSGFYTSGVVKNTANTLFAPALGGSFSVNATSGNDAEDKISASASVTDANAGLLTQIDALNAKIVALNALIAKIMKKLGVK